MSHLDPTPQDGLSNPKRLFMVHRQAPRDPLIVERDNMRFHYSWVVFWDGPEYGISANLIAFNPITHRILGVEEITDPVRAEVLRQTVTSTHDHLAKRYSDG